MLHDRAWLADTVLVASLAEAALLPWLRRHFLPGLALAAGLRALAPGIALTLALWLALRGASTTLIGLALLAALVLHGADLLGRGRKQG